MNRINVQIKALELVDLIKDSQDYRKLQQLGTIIDDNENIKNLIKDFKLAEDKFQEVKRFGKYHPDYHQVTKNFSEVKEKLYENELVKQYKQCERNIEKILSSIGNRVSESVSSNIKAKNKLNLTTKNCSCEKEK